MPDIASWVSIATVVLVLLTLPLLGAFMAATPYLMPKGECFAVTIPDAAARDPYLRGLKRRFALIVGGVTVIGSVLTAAMLLWQKYGPCIAVMLVATLAIVGGGYALMLRYRSKVQAYKRQQGWRAEGGTQVGFVGDEPFAKPLSVKWDLLFLIPIALTAALGVAGYSSMPDMLPLRVDFAGTVTGMQPKSPGLVAFPVIAVAFYRNNRTATFAPCSL